MLCDFLFTIRMALSINLIILLQGPTYFSKLLVGKEYVFPQERFYLHGTLNDQNEQGTSLS